MSLKVRDFLHNFNDLKLLTTDADLDREILIPEISRPGIELAVKDWEFTKHRIQLLGRQEIGYLESIDYDEQTLDHFLSADIPLIMIARNLNPDARFIELANERKIPVVISDLVTSKLHTRTFLYLEELLALTRQIHGVCLSIYGTGVVVIGKSGAGKSELALELIKRGHMLVADDSVILKFIDESHIIGTAPEILKNQIEIRGLGILDVTKLYGISCVLEKVDVKLIVEIKPYEGDEERLGLDIQYYEIEGYKIPKIIIPTAPGRNTANLVETGVANFNLKTIHNFDSAEEFQRQLSQKLLEKAND